MRSEGKTIVAIVTIALTLALGRFALAADYVAATNCLAQTVLQSPIVPATLSGKSAPVVAAEVELVIAGDAEALPVNFDRYWVFEVDAKPFAFQLTHDRQLVVISEDLANHKVYRTSSPAVLRDRRTGEVRGLEPLNDDSIPRSLAPRTAVARGYAAGVMPNGAMLPLANTENNTNLHVVLVSGGCNRLNNGIRFFCDIRNAYQVLHEKCQVPREHIRVFVASGDESKMEHQYENGYVAVDYDLDGDGTKDVTGGASCAAVSGCLSDLAAQLTKSDRLLIVISTHGSRNLSDFASLSTQAWLWGEYVTDEDLREWTKDIKCPVALALQQCYGGGFVDDLAQDSQRVIGTAANHLEYSWGYVGDNKEDNYNFYLNNFFDAVAAGTATDFYSANLAAYTGNNQLAHPQYAESSAHLGYRFRFDALTAPATNYDHVAYNFVDTQAVGFTTNFDYFAGAEQIWRPDVFSATGFHTGWRQSSFDGDLVECTANWVSFASKEEKELSGIKGAIALQLKSGSWRTFRWTAPQDATMRFSLEGSYGSGGIRVTENGKEIISDSSEIYWAAVSFEAKQGVVYELTVSGNTMLTALLSWGDEGILYVDAKNGDDGNDGRDRAQPLRSIQRAIEVANTGDKIEVASGHYDAIVSWNQSLYIYAAEGPLVTIIDGGGTNCCANLYYLSYDDCDTQLEGFTLENGFDSGVLAGGAGIRGGMVKRSIIRNCRAQSDDSVIGVAAHYGVLENCLIYDNTATSSGSVTGGVCFASKLYNCTIADNCVKASGEVTGGGLYVLTEQSGYGEKYYGYAVNSLIVGTSVCAASTVGTNVCDTSGARLIKTRTGGDPHFVDRANDDYHLAEGSQAIDAGYSDYAVGTIDLAGAARLQGGEVDLGCYESSYTATVPEVPAVTPTRGERHYGVFVGINEYLAVNGLDGCVHDVEIMRERCLRSGLWHDEDTAVYTNQFATESAVRSAIAEMAATAATGDTFIFCQSSHGSNYVDEQMDGQICMYDCQAGMKGYDGSYCDYELAADLLKFNEGVKIIVYLDACRSAAMFKSWESGICFNALTSGADAANFAQRVRSTMAILAEGPTVRSAAVLAGSRVSLGTSLAADVATNIAFITAADYDQYSWCGLSSEGGEFTTAFIAGWTNGLAETSGDGKLDFYELYAYAAAIATGNWFCAEFRTEPQCDNAALLAGILAGYAPGIWPEPEIAAGDSFETRAVKLRDAMIGAGFSLEHAAAITNEADYSALVKWAEDRHYPTSELAASPVAFLSPALGADELMSDLTDEDLQLVDWVPPADGDSAWRCSLLLPNYEPARVNESMLRLAVGVIGARSLRDDFTTNELKFAVEKAEEYIEVRVAPPNGASSFFMKAKVR